MFPCKEKRYIYYWCTGEYTFKALSKNTTRLQNFILQKLLIILKSVHNRHIWHNRTQLFNSPKIWAHTDAFLSWTPGIYLKICFTVCRESIHVICSQDIRYWIQIPFEGTKRQLQLTSHSHCDFLPFLIHPGSVIVVNLLEIYSLGGVNKQIESKASDKRE